MLRIANPGSDISSFIRIYCELYDSLGSRTTFGLDDISQVLVERNLATSCGFMGEEALSRSTRKDRSRDPLYNQSKMYSELYKVLGWLHPLPDSALTFRFTYLGAHVSEARRDPVALFKECILGIVYPNAIIRISGDYKLRPFASILKTMAQLDGKICRDEMIIGPLCLENDRDGQKFSEMINELRMVRGSTRRLSSRLQALSEKREISTTTMENYTRFPIAVLKWTGWTQSERRDDIYDRSIPFLVMTEEGNEILRTIENCRDIRNDDLSGISENTKASIIRLGFYQMLGRAGFDLEPIIGLLHEDTFQSINFLDNPDTQLLFSPFQELEPEFVKGLFPNVVIPATDIQERRQVSERADNAYQASPRISSKVTLEPSTASQVLPDNNLIFELFNRTFQETKNIEDTVEAIAGKLSNTNKGTFYPFIAELFCLLGYDCRHSRAGVNYERWDALIIDSQDSIPIEIKSPGEEEFISVKAIRQALENKIILLARKAYPTQYETTSLVVGFKLPNDRSDVASLIMDIYKIYGIKIGVLDLRSLLYIVAGTLLAGKNHNHQELVNLMGIIDVTVT